MAINLESFARFAKEYRDGQIIFSEFEMSSTFFLIQSGQVELVKLDGNTEKTLAILKPMEMFGEMAILDSSPRSATAIAHGDCVLLEFNSKNFESLMLGLPELAMKLLKSFITRMYDSKNRYIGLKKQDPLDRLAEIFVQIEAELPPDERVNNERILNVSIETLARLSGLTEEQTRQTLIELSDEKRIEVRRGSILLKKFSFFTDYLKSLAKDNSSTASTSRGRTNT
ncbi:MAG: Crp/Fnr family transcriptional regulator [Spirochaetaceae bacterium]|jgi:CRP-like cAMP-binding protein|nr:Crp/Fnr family transcriptional regulator [Spirochaetaceae bacterium]